MIKKQIAADLKKVLEKLDLEGVEPSLEHPLQETHGDYATNIALVLWGKRKREEWERQNLETPLDLAKEIVKCYKLESKPYLDKVEVAPPGFINFWLSKKYLALQIGQILKEGKDYGALKVGQGKKVQVEFISANPTGPLHMGNVRGGPIGDVIANVLLKVGYQAEREFYVNDIGGQADTFGKTLLAIEPPKGRTIIGEPAQYRGEFWNELARQVREEIDKQILNWPPSPSDDDLVRLYRDIGVERVLQGIKEDATALGIKFDQWVKESEFAKGKTKEVTEKLKKQGATREKDGALWFAPSDNFLKDRECVLVKSDGSPTYFANDIAYHWNKFQERRYEFVIDVWGANHHGHAPRMKAAMAALGIDPERLRVIFYQWVSLIKEGKRISMSKRKGEFITAREVMEEIGVDAMRFLLLSSSANNHLELDLDLAKRKASENPVFYVQYAHARICSIFKKASQVDFGKADYTLLNDPSELRLLRHLIRLPELVEEISRSYAVHLLPAYAIKLADLFHKFYEECRVISQNRELTVARLALVKATQIVLGDTLSLLGISTPEKM